MTENYILTAFRTMGEHPMAVKLMKNKYTGDAAGYCFVSFLSDEQAIDAMHKLNGKPIPGTNPVVRFRLNSASNNVRSLSSTADYFLMPTPFFSHCSNTKLLARWTASSPCGLEI